jgi:microcystin degradation protein MlrC
MRVAVGGISHETNTFCRGESTLDNFKERSWAEGQQIIDNSRGVRNYIGGIIDAAETLGIELVPTFFTSATPSATISADTYATLRGNLLDAMRAAGEVDAICLTLHGAGVAAGVDDIEGDIIQHIRELFGPDMPIVVTLDLHGNMTSQMVEHADALLGVNLYPHTDSYDRGVEAIELIPKLVSGEVKPVMHLTVLPMMIPSTTTNLSPAKDVNELCWEMESRPGVLDCTFFHGFAPADIPKVGISVLAIADGDPDLAREVSEGIANHIWEIREEFRVTPTPPEEAFRQALATEGRPVIINEKADNPGGGGPGDGTHLLRAMIEADLPEACFGFIYDPETAEQAHDAGAGSTISVRLGGKTEDLHGEPIVTEAYVKCLTDGRFIQQSPMGRGGRVNLGKMARLVIGGIDVLVSSIRTQTLDDEVFRLHGIDVTRYKIVAIKSSNHFRAGFEPISHAIIRADTPGLVSADLSSFEYKRLQRPIWPLDDDVTFS